MKIPKRVWSGIPSLDPMVGGGFPSGSFVILFGESGGGQREFALTAAIMSAAMKTGYLPVRMSENVMPPKQVCYVSFARSKEDLFREIENSFTDELYEAFCNNVVFKDMSEQYLKSLSAKTEKRDEILDDLFSFLQKQGKHNLVILHSLLDLARLFENSPNEFVLFLLKLQRAAKEWGGLVYGLLASKIIDTRIQEEALACADGVIVFDWESSVTERERVMYFKKFRGLMPHVEERLGKFRVVVTPSTGFVVSRMEMVKPLRR